MNTKLEGRNPVLEALRSGREIDKIWVRKGDKTGSVIEILRLAREKHIPVTEVEKAKLDAAAETNAHQGVMAFCAAHTYGSIEDMLRRAEEAGEAPFLVLCDRLSDPHNLGSILRTANCAGAHGVIIPKHESVTLNATVAKTSAGAIEFTPVAKVTNLARTIDELKARNIWVIGADGAGESTMYQTDFSGGVALVIGSEGEGLGRLIREKCDFLVRIPMKGEITSLNASVAAALLMYEVARTRENRE